MELEEDEKILEMLGWSRFRVPSRLACMRDWIGGVDCQRCCPSVVLMALLRVELFELVESGGKLSI